MPAVVFGHEPDAGNEARFAAPTRSLSDFIIETPRGNIPSKSQSCNGNNGKNGELQSTLPVPGGLCSRMVSHESDLSMSVVDCGSSVGLRPALQGSEGTGYASGDSRISKGFSPNGSKSSKKSLSKMLSGLSGGLATGSTFLAGSQRAPPLRKTNTGLSSVSFTSWSSCPSSARPGRTTHSTSSTSGDTRRTSYTESAATSEFMRQQSRRKSVIAETFLGQSSRVVANIDDWIGTVIDDIDQLNEGERFIYFTTDAVAVSPVELNAQKGKRPNRVRTAKFTWLTWLPLSLYMQFKRVANTYFLVIAIVVLGLGEWSPKDWRSKVFPFACVLLWTALKDLFEDHRRKRDDHIENTTLCRRFDPSLRSFVDEKWQDLLVGDVLFLKEGETFPADLILLATQDSCDAFISTMSLDGETNLKKRRLPGLIPELFAVSTLDNALVGDSSEARAKGFLYYLHVATLGIHLAPPTTGIWDVRGRVSSTETKSSCPLNETHFLPRGCVLKHTSWVLAVVGFIGEETKVRMNSSKSALKFSQMQRALNLCVWGLLAGLVIVCLYSATLSISLNDDDVGICCNEQSWLIMFLKYMVTFYHVVPLSLYVCFEMLKLILGFRINVDKQMYDPVSEKGAVARTADLVEEMGQVNFIFSDKTGTLTANEMIFAGCYVDGKDLGNFRKTDDDEKPQGPVNARRIMAGADAQSAACVSEFFLWLAVCHAVQVSLDANGSAVYSGMSPDEVALVQGAQDAGIVFEGREEKVPLHSLLKVRRPTGDLQRWGVLHEIEFNSDRKRMSVLVTEERSAPDSEVFCITKGADSVMETLLTAPFSDEEQGALLNFSRQGLRTLVVASKKLTKKEYDEWNCDYVAAQGTMDGSREEKIAKVVARLEIGLTLAGITAVEDRLQEGVPQAIDAVKRGGIRVWMLTGDKTETAVDIARSCCLFSDEMTIAYATEANSISEAHKLLHSAQSTVSTVKSAGLVLDGKTLEHALEESLCQDVICELGMQSQSAVCCRLSPKQKRALVELVIQRRKGTVALAIGDGANDVPMLEGAHIGIGIRGKEGAQAVQVADVAFSQFRFLVPLLLCHGRRSYWRVALFLNYYLYKSLVLAMGDVIWMHQSNFSGGVAFPEYLSVNYNIFFTSWHAVLALAFDYGVSDDYSKENPELYLLGPQKALFNSKMFSVWMIRGIFHGCLLWTIPNLWYGGTYSNKSTSAGAAEDFWVASCTSFTMIVLVVMLRLLLDLQRPWALTALLPTIVAAMTLVVILAILGYTGVGLDFQPNMANIPGKMFMRSDAQLSMITSVVATLSVDIFEKVIIFAACPKRL